MKMLRKLLLSAAFSTALCASAQNAAIESGRMLWGSIADDSYGSITNMDALKAHRGKVLLSWRLLPGDAGTAAFDVYSVKGGVRTKINVIPISGKTCLQVPASYLSDTEDNVFELTFAGESEVLDSYVMTAAQYKAKLPYVSIKLQPTADDVRINDVPEYVVNDGTIGDLDGDGKYEIVIARCAHGQPADYMPHSPAIMEAYRLDGTFMWRVVWGNNIPASNSIAMIVADVDGDGKEEVAIRSSEGTAFADGKAIGDTNGDGITDYGKVGIYNSKAPEFISVIDGTTGAELARAPYIPIGSSEEWGDDYFKRANSLRLCAAKLLPGDCFQLVCLRGIYAKTELEAWQYVPGSSEMRHIWKFSSDSNKAFIGQGNHQLAVADVDDDGFDEITYGAAAIDHDGSGLYSTGLGHGDMLHVGKFIADRDGLQCFQCFETGVTRCALRDARTGEILWQLDGNEVNDEGRCMISDIDPDNPGYECWVYDKKMYDLDGNLTGYSAASTNFPIWWTGSLNRQLFDGDRIDAFGRTLKNVRAFTLYRYPVATINSTKKNPTFCGDFLGDWREEIIMPKLHPTDGGPGSEEILIFSTPYPTTHAVPYLMSDPVYFRGAKHQHVGYNTPIHLGYYFGSDMQQSGIAPAEAAAATAYLAGRTLHLPAEGMAVSVYTPDGRLALSAARVEGTTLSLAALPAGLYIVHTPAATLKCVLQ